MPFNKKKIFIRDFFTCQSCGGSIYHRHPQIAHKIKQGKGSEDFISKWLLERGYDWSRKKIRDDVINHPFNVVTACSLKCNDAQNLFYKPVDRDILLLRILDDIINPF